jgi:hypothetical protein
MGLSSKDSLVLSYLCSQQCSSRVRRIISVSLESIWRMDRGEWALGFDLGSPLTPIPPPTPFSGLSPEQIK